MKDSGEKQHGPGASVLGAIRRLTGETPRVSLAPLGDETVATDDADHVPEALGRYAVVEELARGGMGVVYRGRDGDLGRELAVKVLQGDLAQNVSAVQRFVEEAQLGGQLQHPGIVPVYELGLMASGQPFFTMKLVRGRTLSELFDARATLADGRRRLLGVFEQMCQTIAYAHARSVIHRDLKPANVMVGAFGEVQVVDWGLAKVIGSGATAHEETNADEPTEVETVRTGADDSAQSVAGSVMGTPAYMAPEQALGRVETLDERVDVFALGAILCELLTDHAPYTGGEQTPLEQAVEADLEEARQRLNTCGADGELVELALACLDPDPAARPRDGRALADAVASYLASVEERAETARVAAAEARVRAEEERRRRRVTLALSATLLAVVGGVGAGWSTYVQRRAEDLRATERSATVALDEARGHVAAGEWNATLAAVSRARGVLAAGTVDAELERAAGERAARLEAARGALDELRVAEENAELLDALADVRVPEKDSAVMARDWGRVDDTYATLFAAHGLPLDALSPAEAADALDEREIALAGAVALDSWRLARRKAGRPRGEHLEEIIALADPDPERTRLRALIGKGASAELAALADEADLASWPPETLSLLGGALLEVEDHARAVAVFQLGALVSPDDFAILIQLGRALLRLDRIALGNRAIGYLTAACGLRPESASARHELGLAYDAVGLYGEAERTYLEAVELKPDDLHLATHVWGAFARVGKLEEATAAVESALERFPESADVHYARGNLFALQRRHADVVEAMELALEYDPEHTDALNDLGWALRQMGRTEDAIAYHLRAIEIVPWAPRGWSDLGRAYAELGRTDEAVEAWERALEVEPSHAEAHYQLGKVAFARGDLDGAVRAYHAAVEFRPDRAAAWRRLGEALAARGDGGEAVEAFRQSLTRDPNRADTHGQLAFWLVERNFAREDEQDDALGHARRATELAPQDSASWLILANVQLAAGDLDGCLDACDRSVDVVGPTSRAWYLRARVALARGEVAEARFLFEEGETLRLRMAPDDGGLRERGGAVQELLEDAEAE